MAEVGKFHDTLEAYIARIGVMSSFLISHVISCRVNTTLQGGTMPVAVSVAGQDATAVKDCESQEVDLAHPLRLQNCMKLEADDGE